jgi:hypothetical protein
VAEATEIERLVGELELAVDRVRSLYEQYFMGIEKLEPLVPRKDVDRRIHILRKEQIRNTAQRFRFQMIIQRYNTYQTHWQRICREMENGTYKRHVIRAQQRFGPGRSASVRPPPQGASVRTPPPPVLSRELAEELAELDREFAPAAALDDGDVELVEDAPKRRPSVPRPGPPRPGPPRAPPRLGTPRPAAPAAPAPPPSAAAPAGPAPASLGAPAPPAPLWRKAPAVPTAPAVPRPAAGSPPPLRPQPAAAAPIRAGTAVRAAPSPPPVLEDLPEDRVRAIYSQYVDAKRRQNESTAAITYDAVAKSLRDSSARLREKHGRVVDFEVAVKDGKAILKPVLK